MYNEIPMHVALAFRQHQDFMQEQGNLPGKVVRKQNPQNKKK